MRRGADTNRTGSKGLARRGGTRKLRAKVCCTPPSNGAQTEIEWTATRVDAAFHMDRHRGSTPLGSIFTGAFAPASFTLAYARWAGFTSAFAPAELVSRALVSRSPALAGLVSRALVSRSPALAAWFYGRLRALIWVHARGPFKWWIMNSENENTELNRSSNSSAGASQTNWKTIIDAASNSPTAGQSREGVARRYWPAIHAFVRKSGISQAEADDVTQAFICDVMLGRDLLARAAPERGRFRSLLLTSVRNFAIDELRRRKSPTRKPASGTVFSLDDDLRSGDKNADLNLDEPEHAFHAQWVTMMIDQAISVVREWAILNSQEVQWDIFNRRILEPMRTGAEPISTETFMKQWSLTSPAQVANTLARMKRKFVAALMEQLGNFDDDPDMIHREVSTLLQALERKTR